MGDPESRLRPPRTNAARQVSVEKGAAPERGGEGLCERVCFDRVNEGERTCSNKGREVNGRVCFDTVLDRVYVIHHVSSDKRVCVW